MVALKILLVVAWILIMASSICAANALGFNWPKIYFGDIVGNPWRSQFNIDFLIHLFLFCGWIYWREESKMKGAIYGFFSIFLGGMFGFAYLLYAIHAAKRSVPALLLGCHYKA